MTKHKSADPSNKPAKDAFASVREFAKKPARAPGRELTLEELRQRAAASQGEDAKFYMQLVAIKEGKVKVWQPSTAPLPKWQKKDGGWGVDIRKILGYVCDDRDAMSFAFGVQLTTGFSIPDFDVWLDSIGPCGAREELMIRREWVCEALHANNEERLRRHLEWMVNRRRGIEREQALLPLAQTGAKVRKPMEDKRAERTRQSADTVAQWQARAVELWAMPQHRGKTAFDIARLIDPQRANTIRRKIRDPKKAVRTG